MPLHHFRYSRLPDSVLIETAEGLLKLTPYSAEIVRVRYTLERTFSAQASLMIVAQAQAPVDFTICETEHSLSVTTAALSIETISNRGQTVPHAQHASFLPGHNRTLYGGFCITPRNGKINENR
jgi:hypothetical protein